jgi:hypothetical protein
MTWSVSLCHGNIINAKNKCVNTISDYKCMNMKNYKSLA